MLFDGIKLVEGSEVQNLVVDTGSAFPSSPGEGELFYRNDGANEGLYAYNGSAWTRLADSGSIVGILGYTPVNVAGDTMSGTLILSGAPSADLHAATKKYVDDSVAALPVSGVTAGTYKSVTVASSGLVTAGTNPTTLSGYGITDAQPIDADLTAIGALSATSGYLKKTNADTWTLDTATFITGNESITLSGDLSGSGTTSITAALATTGVAAGSYGTASAVPTVAVDAKGRITTAANTAIAIDTSAVTSGTFASARISSASVTQHEAALTVLETQITDGTLLARLASNETVTGTWTFSNTISGSVSSATTASSATALATARNITASGDAAWTISFDGTADQSAALTLATVNASPQTDTFRKVTVNAKGLVTATSAVSGSDINAALTYTPVNKAGDTMTGNLILSADQTVSVPTPTGGFSSINAVNKAYVDSVASGLIWENPVELSNLSGELASLPGSPVAGDAYYLTAAQTAGGVIPGGGFAIGDVVQWQGGSTWVLIKASVIGDRYGISFHLSGNETGSLGTGNHNKIITLTAVGATPTCSTWSPVDGHAVFVRNVNAYLFGHSYVYNLSTTTWAEFSGPALTGAGIGLAYTGNTLNVNLGAGIAQLPSDEVGVDVYTGGGLMTTLDGAASSSLTNAQLSLTKVGTAGTYFGVTTDDHGRITAGTAPTGTPSSSTYLRGDNSWATISATATNIANGAAGSIVYQSAANTTAMLAAGTSSQVLVSGATPSWTNSPTLTGTNFTSIPNAGLTNSSLTIGSTSIALGATATSLAGLSSVTSTNFFGALTGTASLATNIAGGVAGGIVYQSGVSGTAITAAGTSGQVLTSNGAAAPTWQTSAGWNGGIVTNATSFTAANPQITLGTVTGVGGGIVGANGNTGVSGSPLWLTPGTGGAGATGGTMYIYGGTAGSGAQAGSVNINGGGASSGAIQSGHLNFYAGAQGWSTSAPGNTTIAAGDTNASALGYAGQTIIKAGDGVFSGSSGGNLLLKGGYSTGAGTGGYIALQTGNTTTERFRILANGAWSVGASGADYGTSGQVLTSNGNAAPAWSAVPAAAAGSLTGATLAAGVTASSLTSVGTLTALAVSGNVARSVATGITAAGSSQGTATAITKDVNVVSTVAASTGVIMPTAVAGYELIVINTGANALAVYPATGGAIDANGTNAAFSLAVGARIMFIAVSATQWYTLNATYA